MTYRAKKPELSTKQKLEKMKALRGQHDQRIRCGVIELLYGTGGETSRFLEEEIRRLEARVNVMEERQDHAYFNSGKNLWQPGANEDGD